MHVYNGCTPVVEVLIIASDHYTWQVSFDSKEPLQGGWRELVVPGGGGECDVVVYRSIVEGC